jgi:hypothetical protein
MITRGVSHPCHQMPFAPLSTGAFCTSVTGAFRTPVTFYLLFTLLSPVFGMITRGLSHPSHLMPFAPLSTGNFRTPMTWGPFAPYHFLFTVHPFCQFSHTCRQGHFVHLSFALLLFAVVLSYHFLNNRSFIFPRQKLMNSHFCRNANICCHFNLNNIVGMTTFFSHKKLACSL